MKVRALRNVKIGGKQRFKADIFDCDPTLVPDLTKPRKGAPNGYVEVITPPSERVAGAIKAPFVRKKGGKK